MRYRPFRETLKTRLPYVKTRGTRGRLHHSFERRQPQSSSRSTPSIPVLKIPVSGYDVCDPYRLQKHSTESGAVVGFESITHGYQAVNTLFGHGHGDRYDQRGRRTAGRAGLHEKQRRTADHRRRGYRGLCKKEEFCRRIGLRPARRACATRSKQSDFWKAISDTIKSAPNCSSSFEPRTQSGNAHLFGSGRPSVSDGVPRRDACQRAEIPMADPGFLARFPDYLPDSKGQVSR